MSKILWHSNAPWSNTGYGVQTRLFTQRMKDAGHDVALSAFYGLEGGILEVGGFTVYPTDHTRRGKHMLTRYVQDHAGQGNPTDDVQVITLMDLWPLVAGGIHGGPPVGWKDLRVAAWTPVDHDPIPPMVLQAIETFEFRPIAMSRFGETQMRENGLDPLYVPHGIDTSVFYPEDDREAIRRAMGVPDGAFVIGMVANNFGCMPPRKSFPQVFQAFAIFRERHPEAFLFLHCDILGLYEGINLLDLAAMNGLPERSFGGVPQEKYLTGTITTDQMRRIYALMDVLANPSYGEGFGVPLVEAQACGVPVVATNWTAMPELVGAGWLVEGDRWYNTPQRSYFKCPAVFEIVEAFEKAYEARDDATLRERAREFALQYDADRVYAEHWAPALAALDRPREAGPLVFAPPPDWLGIGLLNPDGSLSVPNLAGDELLRHTDGTFETIPGGFRTDLGVEFAEPDGVEWLILREIERDYALDDLDLGPKDVAVDVGAHVGLVSIYLAKRYGCQVIAVEPDPANFERLLENITLNEVGQLIKPRRVALTGDGRTVVIGGDRATNSGGLSIYAKDGELVQSITLADLFERIDRVALLKIDCEGAEHEILADLEPLRNVRAIRGEFHHGERGDPVALVARVAEIVPDTKVTIQGTPPLPTLNREQRRALAKKRGGARAAAS